MKLGLTAFGGPAAHIAMMEQEFVGNRAWLSHEEFLDLLGAVNLIPGPSSTEMALFIGYRRAGWRGLMVGGLCFILPAAILVSALAWGYVRFGTLPQAEGLLSGIKPVLIAVVLQALWGLGRRALKTRQLAVVGIAATAFTWGGVNPLFVLLGGGLAMISGRVFSGRTRSLAGLTPAFSVALPTAGSLATGLGAPFGLWGLFLAFLKVGSVVFGSGYVLLGFLRDELVQRRHWLTEGQLLDAVAVGQFTPGPVFTTATFIGFIKGGPAGALVATVGIFLPSFILVALGGRIIPRLRRSPAAAEFLDGVNAASLAIMAVVTGRLGVAALVNGSTVAWGMISLFLLVRYRVNSAWLVLAGAVAGLVAGGVRPGF